MNPIARHFLPSVMRGVYRLDDALTAAIDGDAYRRFISMKMALIPRRLAGAIEMPSDLGQIQPPTIGNILAAVKVKSDRRAAEFFRCHPYFANALNGNGLASEGSLEGAQNFLEVQFVRKILAPLLSDEGLGRLRPQQDVGSYYVDFALCGTRKFALEVDGFGKFQTPDDLDHFNKRQNFIAKAGWTVIRYTYSQIMRTTAATLRNFCSILALDSQLEQLLDSWPGQGQTDLFSDPEEAALGGCLIDRVNDFHRVQDLFADFCATHHPQDKVVAIRDGFRQGYPFVAVALSGLYEWLDAVAGIVDVDFDLPMVRVCGSVSPTHRELWLHAKVSIEADDQNCHLVIDQAAILQGTAAVPSPPGAEARRIEFRRGLSLEDIHQRLKYFTENVFAYPGGTTPFQNRVLQRIFDGRDVLGIATTGSGKSFCFWLPAILRPGLTIVVAPLRSLMRDQMLSLRKNGIAVAEFINVDVPEPGRLRIMEEARLGFIRLLYVAPERLRIKQFLDQLENLMRSVPINLLAIDEAHCISEWGHDFRPSYLKLPWVRESLSREDSPLKLIALTATAGPMVVKDMLEILRLRTGDDGDLIRDVSLDRERFSYQIVRAENGGSKTQLFQQILQEHTPKALKQRRLKSLLSQSNRNGEKALGMVFCIYADPHGRQSTHEGTSHYLYQAMSLLEKKEIFDSDRRSPRKYRLDAYSTGKVRVFASKKPTLCPYCHSYDYTSKGAADLEDEDSGEDNTATSDDGTGVKTCGHCGRNFNDSAKVSPPTWDKVIKSNQDAFKDRHFDILVATKGFGMGIDQSSIRFVVHTALSSGLESWYQEVGRAGRDKERSHIVLLTEPPNDACMSVLAKAEIQRPECKSYRSGCPHGKTGLCDYGKQHMFITRAYPGEASDAFRSLIMLDQIFQSLPAAMNGPIIVYSSHDRLSFDEIALYRLTVLGLVRDYVVAYQPRPHFLIDCELSEVPDTQERLSNCKKVMQQQLREYFSHIQPNPLARSDITELIELCQKEFGQLEDFPKKLARLKVLNKFTPLFDETASQFLPMVYGHLLFLLEHVYDQVLKMRYTMLSNLMAVVTSKVCRRRPILNRLGQPPGEEYRCGMCDVCAPDLDFLEIRNTPSGMATNEELERRLEKIFADDPDSFDLKLLRELINEFKDYPTAKYGQARTIIEGSPNNLSALFVAREFSPPAELEGNARRLLRTANRLCSLADVMDLYSTSPDSLKADMLVKILNDANSACDTIEGWKFLVREASNPKHRETASVAAMGECLKFFLIVERLIPEETRSIKQKTLELEAAFHG